MQPAVGGGDAAKVKELEAKVKDLERRLHANSGVEEVERRLLETRMLYTTTIDDYDIVRERVQGLRYEGISLFGPVGVETLVEIEFEW